MSTPAQIGPYRLQEKLGSGGMGVVHLAVHDELEREFAVKLIHAGDEHDEESRRRFLREARAAAELGEHPGIVAVRDAGEHEGRAWLAMDVVRGESLDRMLDQGDLDPRTAALLVAQSARAVQHAHDHGILHRDLKPPNILVTRRPPSTAHTRPTGHGEPLLQAVVTDFGLARWQRADADVSKLTKTGFVVGTPAYMSPELARADAVDGRSDVYALGATLYECLAGRPPFVGNSLVRIFNDLLRTPPPPPRLSNPSVPDGLQNIALKCLEKDPGRRYATAGALADDLERWMAGGRVRARPGWRRITSAAGRHPLTWLSIGAVVVIGAGAAFLPGSEPDPVAPAPSGPSAAPTVALAERARAITAVLQRLHSESGAALRVLEDAWQGVPVPPETKAQALRRVREVVATAERQFPDSAVPQAWLGVAEFVGGDADRGNGLLQAAVRRAGDDPIPAVLYVRLAMADYANFAELPDVYWDTQGMHMGSFTESDRLASTRERALTGLRTARQSPLWDTLDGSVDARPFLEGAWRLAERDYAGAAAALERARQTPPLEREAQALMALAWYLAGRTHDAAQAWEGLARQGWLEPMHKAAVAYAGEAAARDARGEDPLPVLRAATDLLARIPEGISAHNRSALLVDRGRAWRELGEALDSRGQDPFEAYDAAADAFDAAGAAAPADAGVQFERGWLFGARADAHERRGRDPRPDWERSIAAYDACAQMNPEHSRVHNNRGNAWTAWANAGREHGEDVREAYGKGIDDFTTAMAREPDSAANVANRASAWRGLALLVRDRGEDARPFLDRAIEDATTALDLDPGYALALGTRGNAWWNRGAVEKEHGLDPRGSYRKAVADHTEAIARRPGWMPSHLNRAAALVWLATSERTRGGDPTPYTTEALADADEAVRLAPGDGRGYARRSTVHIEIAQWQMDRKEDPEAACAACIREGEAALARNPASVDALSAVTSAHQLRAYWASGRGEDPRPHRKEAVEALTRWLEAYPRSVPTWIARAGEARRFAEEDARRGKDPRPIYRQAIADLTRALKIRAGHVRALVDRGELLLMTAYIEEQQGDGADRFREALADFTAALGTDPNEWRALGYSFHALLKLGRIDEARVMLGRVEAATPDTDMARAAVEQMRGLLESAAGH